MSKKTNIAVLLGTALLLTAAGCGSKDPAASETSSPAPASTAASAGTASSSPVATASSAAKETAKPAAAEKMAAPAADSKASAAEEKLALEYIAVYQNGSDTDAKKAFVRDRVMTEAQVVFEPGANLKPSEGDVRGHPKVAQSVSYSDPQTGTNGSMVLVQSDGGMEDIVYIVNGKIAFVYVSKDPVTFPMIRQMFQ